MPTTETRTPTREADAGAPPTAGACPRCGAPLNAPVAWCPRCRLDLTGPSAAELSDLNLRHQALCHRRAETLRALDGELAAIAERRHQVLSALGRQEAGATGTVRPGPPSGGRGATNGWGTQMLLLALGVLCLTIAAAVFAAVGWDRLNQWGQAGVLIAATVAAGVGGVVLFRRGLRATGEAVLALGTVMVLVDIATFGSALGAGTGDLRFWSGGLAVLAVLGAVSRRFGPLTGGVVAAIAAQAPLPLAVFAALGNPSATGFDLTLWNPDPTQPGIAAASVVLIVQALAAALGAASSVRRGRRRWSSPG
ncbi:MAG: zinc ribbon domain-containing protein [Microthrixaceae bacterium]